MLPAVILTAMLLVPSPGIPATATAPAPAVRHAEHIRHELHLAHRHVEHLRHLAELEARHILTGLYPGDVPSRGHVPSGEYLSCRQLEDLWVAAGGATAAAFIAAEIARAESGGYQYATGAVGERGFWQINPVNGALSTYDKMGNARAAIVISDDGRDWSAWTTYTHGLYIGQCSGAVALLPWPVGVCVFTWYFGADWPDRVDDALIEHACFPGGL